MRKQNIRKLHIWGIVLTVLCIPMLSGTISLLLNSILEMSGMDQVLEEMVLALAKVYFDFMNDTAGYEKLSMGMENFSNIRFGITMAMALIPTVAAIVVLIVMKNVCTKIADDPSPMINAFEVKKTPYVLLGFFLGAFGGHYFYTKDSRAKRFLIMGLIGTFVPAALPLLLYTTAISLSDALLACFYEKNKDGIILLESYEGWI